MLTGVKTATVCGLPFSRIWKSALAQVLDQVAVIVGDDGRDLDVVDLGAEGRALHASGGWAPAGWAGPGLAGREGACATLLGHEGSPGQQREHHRGRRIYA